MRRGDIATIAIALLILGQIQEPRRTRWETVINSELKSMIGIRTRIAPIAGSRWTGIEVKNRETRRRKTLTNSRFTNDAFPLYLSVIPKRQVVRKLSTFHDYTARQVKMLIDSRSRLERVRKLRRRLRSLFAQVTSKGIGREILARSQYAWLGHVLKARHTASKSNVRADFAIKSDEPYDRNRFMHATIFIEDKDAKSPEIELTNNQWLIITDRFQYKGILRKKLNRKKSRKNCY